MWQVLQHKPGSSGWRGCYFYLPVVLNVCLLMVLHTIWLLLVWITVTQCSVTDQCSFPLLKSSLWEPPYPYSAHSDTHLCQKCVCHENCCLFFYSCLRGLSKIKHWIYPQMLSGLWKGSFVHCLVKPHTQGRCHCMLCFDLVKQIGQVQISFILDIKMHCLTWLFLTHPLLCLFSHIGFNSIIGCQSS